MQVVIISQLGMIDEVYTIEKFIDEVNRDYLESIDYDEDKGLFTVKELDDAIDYFVETTYSDDCLTVDVMEVKE